MNRRKHHFVYAFMPDEICRQPAIGLRRWLLSF